MSFGITGIHSLEQRFAVEKAGESYVVSIRQGDAEIVLLKLRDPSEASARALVEALSHSVAAVYTPSVVQAIFDDAIEGHDTPAPGREVP